MHITNTQTSPIEQTTKQPLSAVQAAADSVRHAKAMMRIISKRSFATLATSSPAGYSHAAGVVYQEVDGELWIHTMRSSRKARNIAASGKVGVGVAFRRLPLGPPFTIHYQAAAELVPMDAPEVVRLIEAGALKRVAGHGALDTEDGYFIRIEKPKMLHSYGPGARIIDLIRDPLNNGAKSVAVPADVGVVQ